MILQKAIVVGSTVIPAGSELLFDSSGLAEYDGKQIDITAVPDDAIANEAITLKTKGQLAVDMLISCCITILASCPPEDRNNLRRVLTAARQASTTSKPSATFKKLLKLDDVQ